MDTTIVYLTNNILDPKIDALCRKNILDSIGDLRLVSVSQKPIDFGENIVVGKLPYSSLSICLQAREALKVIDTPYVAMAEHDCLYTNEHFAFTPPDIDTYWYNTNVWFLQLEDGLYSRVHDRKANSQLICGTDALRRSIDDRIEIMGDPKWLNRYPTGRVGEPGAMDYDHSKRLSSSILPHDNNARVKLEEYVTKHKANTWKSKIPNIDFRHNDNFTKCRRGLHRKYELEPWGKLEDVLNGT